MKKNKPANFSLLKLQTFDGAAPKGTCPKCGLPRMRIVKGVCNNCYQSEYIKNRKEERKNYLF